MSVILALSFAVNSFAVDMESPEIEIGEPPEEFEVPATSGNDYLDMVLNGMQNQISDLKDKVEVIEDDVSAIGESSTLPDSTNEDVISEEVEEINPDTDLPVSVALMSVAPITPESTSGLKAVLLSVIGDYDPVVVEYEYRNNNNTGYSYLREILPDYPWCASFIMLALFVYCIFRLGGALIG